MVRMRVAQVAAAGAPLEVVEREVPEPGERRGPDPGGGLRRLPQRCVHGRGRLSGHPLPEGAGPRGRGPHRRARTRGRAMAGGTAGRRRLARWALRPLRPLPARRFHHLPGTPHPRHRLRRRLCRLHDRARARARAHPGRARFRGCSTPAVRRYHHVQRPAPQRRPSRRPGRRPGHRRPRPSGAAVRVAHGLRGGRDRPRQGQGGAGAHAGRPPLSGQPGGRRRRPSSPRAAAPASSSRRSPAPRRCRP